MDAQQPPSTVSCPYCGACWQIDSATNAPILHCASCDADFFVGDALQEDDAVEAEAFVATDELDAARIRKITSLRRAERRSRSYLMILVAACCVAIVQLGLMLVRRAIETGWDRWTTVYLAGIVALVIAAFELASRLQHEEVHQESEIDLPAPDFSQLDNGTARAQNLERIDP